jgi:hypothetical protein
MIKPIIKGTMMLSVAVTSTATLFVVGWVGLALLGF